MEIIKQMDELKVEVDTVIIPVGGGGLLAGMAVALKHLRPNVKVIVSLHCMALFLKTLVLLM